MENLEGEISLHFSIIIPFYNAEKYLEECLSSVISQTISFKDNINLILINDGSTDKSEGIAKRFQNKYPNNIFYEYIINSGPAVARNKGIELIPPNTKYISFLDADDMLEYKALEVVKEFFVENPKINLAVLPVYYFEKKNSAIKLNNRFDKGTRVIDINNEFNSPQFYIGGVFIRSNALNNVRFNENLLFWEDALFINKIIVREGKYGVVDNTKYFYRKRLSEDSLVDTSWYNKYRYTDLIYTGYFELINYSNSLYNKVIPYVQYLIIYHLKLFVFQKNSKILLKVLSNSEQIQFINSVKSLLKNIDDKYIIKQNTKKLHKDFLLSLKKGKSYTIEENIKSVNKKTAIKITSIKIKPHKTIINGYFYDDNYMLKNSDKIFAKSFLLKNYAKRRKLNKQIKIWGYVVRDLKNSGFSIQMPIWALFLTIGVESSNNIINLKKVNVLKVILNKFLNKFNSKFQ